MELLVKNSIDLTKISLSFPEIPENEIFRENIVNHIKDSFSSNKRVIMIEDVQFSGKTIILSQFARSFPDRCISFFIGDDYWSSNLHRFLSELCQQIKLLCLDGKHSKISEIDFSTKSENELKQLFSTLNSRLIRQAKNGHGPYYFVIDGLDKINDESPDNILKYIPNSSSEDIFVLLSSRKGRTYNIYTQHVLTLPKFSIPETNIYLKDYLSKEQVGKIYQTCDGLPGYLQEIRRQLKTGKDPVELLKNPPKEFIQLLENEWGRFDKENGTVIKALSFIVFSPADLSISSLGRLLSINETEVYEIIDSIPFIGYDEKKQKIELLSTYKSFLEIKLSDYKINVNQDLITYFEKNPTEENLFVYLPELYRENEKFEALSQLINESSLIKMLGSYGQVSIVRRNLSILAEMAYDSKEWEKLTWATLMQSIFTSIITSPPAIEEEINALLSLNKYDEAISLSLKCILPEDKLKLLSNICNHLKEKNEEIPNDLMRILEDSVYFMDNTIELTEYVTDKLMDIAAEIFPFNPNLALKLVKRISDEKGESHNDRLMDILLMRLIIKIKPDPSSIEEIKNQLGQDSLHEFTKAASTAIASNSIESILSTVQEIDDISAKLFLLQTWCNTNQEHPSCHQVIKMALEIMTESTTYSPTLVHLREFATPLLNTEESDVVKNLVSKIDILKETIIKNPIEEYARLEVTLAEIQTKWSQEDAITRLYSLIFLLDDIEELDSRCQVLAWILISLKNIVPSDKKLEIELREQFITDYKILLETSADHFLISKRLIPVITKFNHVLADDFIDKINTQERRDFAFSHMLRVYIRINKEEIDINFVNRIIDKISFQYFKDWVTVQCLKGISKYCKSLNIEEKMAIKEMVYSIKSSIGKTYALAFYLVILNDDNKILRDSLFSKLKESYFKIDSLEQKMVTGYRVTRILSLYNIDFANIIFNITNSNRNLASFSDGRINDLYIATCNLIINTIPEISKSNDFDEKLKTIESIIDTIPSKYEQISLLNSLAIKCYVSGVESVHKTIADKCIQILDECNDEELYSKCLTEIAPTLFLYEREILFERIEKIPNVLKNKALYNTIKVLMSKRLPQEIVDLESLNGKIDYRESLQICDILEKMTKDVSISTVISSLVGLIVEPKGNNKLRGRLNNEKQLLTIAERLSKIIKKTLPDKDNIKHDGYRLISQAELSKLKHAAIHARANNKWKELVPNWEVLKNKALSISNSADLSFVLTNLSKNFYLVDPETSRILSVEAEKSLLNISNYVDRIERYQYLAETLHETKNSPAAKDLLQKAMDLVTIYSYEERDQMIGRIIEAAHNIEPNLATNLASKVDNPFELSKVEENINALILHSNPQRIEDDLNGETRYILNNVFERLLKSLRSGKGTIQSSEIVGKYVLQSLGQDYETVNLATNWFIENTVASIRSQAKLSRLDDLFFGLVQMVSMIKKLGDFLITNEVATTSYDTTIYKIISPTDTYTFGINEKERAMIFISEWLSENVKEYVKIYDPYFNEDFIFLLKPIPTNCRAQIMLSMKEADVESLDLKEIYSRSWERVCDQLPPETNIFVYYTKKGKTPMHDRYIVSESGGLHLGTSLNGFGSKNSTIQILDYEKKIKIENEIINPFILPPSTFQNEKLSQKIFTLT